MKQIEFVKTDLMALRIGLVTEAISAWMCGGTGEAQSTATVNIVIDRGATLMDTAPAYGLGRSGELGR